ncbi:MAG TPA: ABC transporter permease, partial [Candidatus Dormibacteraeota bacterium]
MPLGPVGETVIGGLPLEPEAVVTAPTGIEGGEVPEGSSPLRLVLAVFTQNRLAVLGLVVVVFFALFCFLGPVFYHTNQIQTNLAVEDQGPSLRHLLGTDDVGYDILGRLMVGGQTTLVVGLVVALLATSFGVIWGAIAGFSGGVVDTVLMRTVDAMLAIPTLFLLLFLASIFTPSEPLLIVVIA